MVEKYREIKKYVKKNEGSKRNSSGRHILYKCTADKWTCAYGRNAEDNGFSDDEAELMLTNDIDDCVKSLLKIFGYSRLYRLSKNRQIVLIDMVFNMGETQFLEFKRMIRAVKNDNFEEAARQIKDSKYFRRFRKRANQNMKLMGKG